MGGKSANAAVKPRLVSFYSGCGGLDFGFHEAGFEPIWANDIDPVSVKTYENLVGPHIWLGDIDDLQAPGAGSAEIVVGGPPCFVAGTLVLTLEGYKRIESIEVGDMVLTHNRRWRRVTDVMDREAGETRIVRAQGVPALQTTHEHPFWVRWCTQKSGRRVFSEPEWVEASAIPESSQARLPSQQRKSAFVAQVLPDVAADPRSAAMWWLVGRWLADGWLRVSDERKRQVVIICCGKSERDELLERLLDVYPDSSFTQTEQRTTTRFELRDHELYELLQQFGRGAAGKFVPGWVMSLDQEKAGALLEGYLSGDGSARPECDRAGSVSRALVLSMALIAQRARGVVSSLGIIEVSPTKEIEGRIVNQQPWYQLQIPEHNRSAFVEGEVGWRLVRKNEVAGPARVFNLSVEEDESYVVENVVVHNCQGFSHAGKMDPNDPRSKHVWKFLELVERIQPQAFVMENVKALAENNRWAAVREGLIKRAELMGYKTKLHLLNAADFGVPQARERMFLIGVKSGVPVEIEPTTAGDPVTVRQALKTLPPYGKSGNDTFCVAKITAAKQPVLRKSPYAGMLFNGAGRPLNLDAPALTLPATMGGNRTPIIDQEALENNVENWAVGYHKHLWDGGKPLTKIPSRLRRLTVEEAAALQTFPCWMEWTGPTSACFRQIGNAVPPELAYNVAIAVRKALGL